MGTKSDFFTPHQTHTLPLVLLLPQMVPVFLLSLFIATTHGITPSLTCPKEPLLGLPSNLLTNTSSRYLQASCGTGYRSCGTGSCAGCCKNSYACCTCNTCTNDCSNNSSSDSSSLIASLVVLGLILALSLCCCWWRGWCCFQRPTPLVVPVQQEASIMVIHQPQPGPMYYQPQQGYPPTAYPPPQYPPQQGAYPPQYPPQQAQGEGYSQYPSSQPMPPPPMYPSGNKPPEAQLLYPSPYPQQAQTYPPPPPDYGGGGGGGAAHQPPPPSQQKPPPDQSTMAVRYL